MTLGEARPAFAVSVGRFVSPSVGFELEYMSTIGTQTATRSQAQCLGGQFIVQTSRPTRRLRFYGVGGIGLYGETYRQRGSGEIGAKHLGGGTKVSLTGPLVLRLDYRVYFLGDAPDAAPDIVVHRRPHRMTAGLGLAF